MVHDPLKNESSKALLCKGLRHFMIPNYMNRFRSRVLHDQDTTRVDAFNS
jgi:hypothetical protein